MDGFLLTTAIILVVGLMSYIQQGKLQHKSAQNGTEVHPTVQNILRVKSEAASIRPYATAYG